jgi:hypothetical protein
MNNFKVFSVDSKILSGVMTLFNIESHIKPSINF